MSLVVVDVISDICLSKRIYIDLLTVIFSHGNSSIDAVTFLDCLDDLAKSSRQPPTENKSELSQLKYVVPKIVDEVFPLESVSTQLRCRPSDCRQFKVFFYLSYFIPCISTIMKQSERKL